MRDSNSSASALTLPHDARVIGAGLGFTEGPAALNTGEVGVVSINRGKVYAVDLQGAGAREIAETGGGPNCLAVGAEGEIWVTQNGATAMASKSALSRPPSIQRIDAGVVSTVLDTGVSAPSDCVIGPDGRLWFTDPASHGTGAGNASGALRVFDPETSNVCTLLEGLQFPNGLCFAREPGHLYVAETVRGVVRRYRFDGAQCQWDGWEVEVPGGTPDGIALDSQGWLWVAGGTGDNVVAFDPAGKVRNELSFGHGVLVTSVCFAGERLDTLVVTVAKGGSVIALPAIHPGQPLPVTRLDEIVDAAKRCGCHE